MVLLRRMIFLPACSLRSASKQSKQGKKDGSNGDPTYIGSLKESVAWGAQDSEEDQPSDVPRARGLVKDTVDPRLKKTAVK